VINSATIPADLIGRPQWVNWRTEMRDGRPTKPPISANTGAYASSTDPRTWATFEKAIAVARCNAQVSGVGFVFTNDDAYVGIDFDKCRNAETREIAPWALGLVRRMNSYTEVSPTGTGLHTIARGSVPQGAKRGQLEIYDRGRYFTITGAHLAGTPLTIEERDNIIAAIYTETAPKTPTLADPCRMPIERVDLNDIELLDRARRFSNGARFAALFDAGDWRGCGYESQSSADLVLASALAFITNRDAPRIDWLFRASGLMRPKWDERHYGDGRTYGEATIEKAIAGLTNTYASVGPR
jgi:putative DNA primase/helicase